MRSRRALPPIVVAVLVALAVPGRAGGWDSLTFPERQYVVGEVASARGQFFAGELEGAGPLDGRAYHAYLLTGSRNALFAMIDAPTIPPDAIDLGVVDVSEPIVAGDGYPYGVASLTFTVPDVPSGTYAIGFCDDPCIHSSIGWLATGRIRIVHTRYEGTILRRLDRRAIQISRLEVELRRAERAAERAGAPRPRFSPPIPLREPAPAPASSIVRVESPPEGASVTWWVAVLSCVLGLGAGVALGRRRSDRALAVPDTVPDDLDAREPSLRR